MLIPLMLKIKKDVAVIAINESFCFHFLSCMRSKIRYVKAARAKRAFTYLICVVLAFLDFFVRKAVVLRFCGFLLIINRLCGRLLVRK